MIIIIHKVTKENPYASHNAFVYISNISIPTFTRPWWVSEGAGKVRYWTHRERFLNES